MDLKFNSEYCVFVTVLTKYNNQFLFDKNQKPIQGVLRYKERIEDCAKRLVKETLNQSIENLEFIGLGESFGFECSHGHNFIMIADVEGFSENTSFSVVQEANYPEMWLPLINAEDFDFYEYRTVEPSSLESKDLSYAIATGHEFTFRVSAVIRSDQGILFDDAHNLIGGRQRLNETIYQALEREVKEESGYDIDDSYFIGIAEDIVELPKYNKIVHYLNLVFEVSGDFSENIKSSGQGFVWKSEDDIEDLDMGMVEVKHIIESM
ncbi:MULTISPECIES: NUDIX domain-containing protein [Erysipelothrix]|uniref:NUDIX domain-containing protein n=1 Tax=Erysipelothrix TaxID=1647 RepID=UPI001378B679|nr:NUDIX hydrolase [Erysipelothrix sp. strain 2 (EsS2-6-Brazil)]MBK2402092.1 NUDIX hydrolase [Erysipelothrix sp. strain 2 (EsS2-6-Brazil)]NBA01127.1 NUDIX domain-containing protein [Erysipelothrix rhusiopathiae]